MERQPTIFSDLLRAAGIRHTQWYSDQQFAAMPFATLFGLTQLLKSYGVESGGLRLADAGQIDRLPAPFVAVTRRGPVVVTAVDPEGVSYLTQGVEETAPRTAFQQAMTGDVLVIFPTPRSVEPDYESHEFTRVANRAKKWVLLLCAAALFAYLFIANRLYQSATQILITAIDVAGVYIGLLLVQKSAHISNRHADAVCAVVEAGGCDDVLDMPASKFFGVFGWSEVGLAYFSVSLLTILVFPRFTGYLAAINVICLPFSFWSVWYQKFRAKTWCTLCLCVQSMLWLLFACYLCGGWLRDVFPLRIEFFVLAVSYVTVTLAINAVMPLIDRHNR